MRHLLFLAPLLLIFSAMSAFANARMSVLVDVLKLSEAAVILSDEGLGQAQDINADMLNGQGGAGWQQQVEAIYDPMRMVELVRHALEEELSGEALEQVISFFASDLGSKIISLENSARIAIQDPDVEEAARARYRAVQKDAQGRIIGITRYISLGDMITRNVASAMNSNYQFLRGLVDGDAFEMSEEEMLSDAAGDLDETTADTTEWLYGYLLLAYHPLDDDELATYIAFAETPAGAALNRALFAGFEAAYEDISYGLGRAVALNMTAQEL